MRYKMWNCKERRIVARGGEHLEFSSIEAAQRVCDAMNGQLSEPRYAVVVQIKEVVCFS